MIGRKFSKPSHVQVRKFIPLADLKGYALDDIPVQEWSYGRSDLPYNDSADMLMKEDMEEDERYRGSEMAEGELAQSREQQILEQLQELMAEQQLYSQGVMEREEQEGRAQDVLLSQIPLSMPMPQVQQRPQQPESFGRAFAAARRAGAKIFTWRGRKFNTRLK